MSAAGWFWIGVPTNIIISIIVGLNISKIQRWLEDRGKTSHEKKKNKQADEYNQVMYYSLHTDLLIAKMVGVAMWFALYTFSFTILSFLRPTFDALYDAFLTPHFPLHLLSRGFQISILGFATLAMLIALASWAMFIVREVTSVYSLYLHVRYFESYADSVADDLRNHKMERIVIDARWDRSVPISPMVKVFQSLLKEASAVEAAAQSKADGTPDTPSAPQA